MAVTAADEVRLWVAGPPLSTRRWRTALARVRTAIRVAQRQQGRARRHALVRACRLLMRVDPPKIRAFDRAEWALEIRLTKIANECIGCLAMAPLPEDPPNKKLAKRRGHS